MSVATYSSTNANYHSNARSRIMFDIELVNISCKHWIHPNKYLFCMIHIYSKTSTLIKMSGVLKLCQTVVDSDATSFEFNNKDN